MTDIIIKGKFTIDGLAGFDNVIREFSKENNNKK